MRNIMALIALAWAIGLSVASLIIPPRGVIDSSVLVLLAQIIVFTATLAGIALPKTFANGNQDNKKVAEK